MGLKFDKKDVWQEVKNIQDLRNNIVHGNGKLKAQSGRKDITKYVRNSRYLSGDDEIKILEGYLSHVLETLDRQFQDIDTAIRSSSQST